MEYPLDPKAEIFKWGPIPFKLFYGDWDGLFLEFSKQFPGQTWPLALCLFREGRFLYLSETKKMVECGTRAFFAHMLPTREREKAKLGWRAACARIESTEQQIEHTELQQLPIQEFVALWGEFHTAVRELWGHGSLPEIANYGAVDFLESKLRSVMRESDVPLVMEVLTAAEEPSFYQQEEIELAATDDVESHRKKYVWLANSYDHVEVLSLDVFRERKGRLSPSISKDVAKYIADVRQKKIDTKNAYELPQEIMEIAEVITDGIIWQDERKKYIWKYLHYKDMLLNEVVRRFGWDKTLLLQMLTSEIAGLMKGEHRQEEYEWRRRDFGMLYRNSEDRPFFDETTADRYWRVYTDPHISRDVKEFKGIIASKGKGPVKGRVRIVLDARKPGDFRDGDVLVAPMTSPEFVSLMRRSVAIITDTGGLMSHAAVVSREFNVPCIVGTKVATSVLKDGDMVEVDANTGMVRKL